MSSLRVLTAVLVLALGATVAPPGTADAQAGEEADQTGVRGSLGDGTDDSSALPRRVQS